MRAYVHVLSVDQNALLDFLEDAEASFLEFGIAPDMGTPTALPLTEARDHAQIRPTTTSTDGWLPYLTPELLAEIPAQEPATIHYVGVSGMTVTDRVLRETTGTHEDIVLQSHTYTGIPLEFTVYQYDDTAQEFVTVASGEYA